jgi:hypothetical protein
VADGGGGKDVRPDGGALSAITNVLDVVLGDLVEGRGPEPMDHSLFAATGLLRTGMYPDLVRESSLKCAEARASWY